MKKTVPPARRPATEISSDVGSALAGYRKRELISRQERGGLRTIADLRSGRLHTDLKEVLSEN